MADTREPNTLTAAQVALEISKSIGLFDSLDPLFKDAQAVLDFSRNAYLEWQSLNAPDRMVRGSDEFYSTSLIGCEGGEALLPVIELGLNINKLFLKLVNPNKSLVINSAGFIGQASLHSNEVYVPNNIHTYFLDKYLDCTEINNNVYSISYESIFSKEHTFDYATMIFGTTVDQELLTAVLDSISVGGVFVLSGASNGGEIYAYGQDSYAYKVHQFIIDRGDFELYNIPNFMSQTVCIKNAGL